ncbi:MAG: caspase family protein [Chitinophagaceae bacterium]|nr:caspase family protein [Chitinophagaceae bacterium]
MGPAAYGQDPKLANLLNEPSVRYNGDPRTAIKIIYYSKKLRGAFTKTGDKEWTEINSNGTFKLMEKTVGGGEICLVDEANNRQLLLNLKAKTIMKGKVGNAPFYSEMASITGIEADPYYKKQFNSRPESVGTVQTKSNTETPVAAAKKTTPVTETIQDIPQLDGNPVFHALLIAENEYSEPSYNALPGTLRDMRKMYNLLSGKYTFDPGNIDTLVNASKEKILSTLNTIAKSLTENDNLFIFYAGHGIIKRYEGVNGKKVREEGFLIPSNAAKGDEVTFINSYDITSILNRSNAKHILFTADACFAGSLFRDLPADASLKVREAYKNKSRRLLTSGNKQAVSDESDFVESLRLALQENTKKYVTAGELVDGFRDQYISKTHMQLQYNPIPNVDDQGGEFVFFKRQ